MSIHHHLDEATIVAYAAGSLDESASIIVASHLACCNMCREKIRLAEQIGASLVVSMNAEALEPRAIDAALDRIEQEPEGVIAPKVHEDRGVPGPLARHMEWPLDDVPWKKIAPGILICHLPLSENARGELKLIRVAAGKKIPAHSHQGTETTLVLRGWFEDEHGRFGPGDISEMDDEGEHTPVVGGQEDCICVVATEGPLQFKSFVNRLVQPFVNF